jgi:hypothetical protein
MPLPFNKKRISEMWIFMSGAMVSIVADRNNANNLLVRARAEGHIEKLFPKAKVFQVDGSDYLFRALVPRKTVSSVIAKEICSIEYDNFKNSVRDEALHNSYLDVWGVMQSYQLGAYDPCQWR